jgi:hypothetical protein
MSKRKARDGCEVCKEKGRNPVGHLSKYCAWPGGPYENNMSGAKAAQREDRKKAKSEKSVQSVQISSQEYSQFVCESKETKEEMEEKVVKHSEAWNRMYAQLNKSIVNVSQLTAKVLMLEKRISKIEDEKKSSVAKGSKGLVSKGSKGKGKGISAPAPRKYYGDWGWDY